MSAGRGIAGLARKLRRGLGLAAALGALAGCGTESSQAVQLASETFARVFQRGAPEPPPLRERLTPQVLEALGGPVLIVELRQTGSEAGAQLLRRTDDRETWSTLNGVQFTFRQGVLQATRGLAGDLMAADLGEVLPALANGGRGAVRVHRYLDGERQEFARALVCDYTRAGRETITVLRSSYMTTRTDETCVSSTETVENQYWRDERGVMRRSRQWVGALSGYVVFERIGD